jgi:predicted acetyltransferase
VQFEIVHATRDDEPVLAALAELYQYDFTEFSGEGVGEDGRFGSDFLARYWTEPGRHAYLARADGKLAGFALVRRGSSFDTPDVWDMVEFFVMRKYRRSGLVRYMARGIFDRLGGRWEVREIAANTPAQSFWRRIIGEYADGRYSERSYDDERWRGPVQSFDTRKPAAV